MFMTISGIHYYSEEITEQVSPNKIEFLEEKYMKTLFVFITGLCLCWYSELADANNKLDMETATAEQVVESLYPQYADAGLANAVIDISIIQTQMGEVPPTILAEMGFYGVAGLEINEVEDVQEEVDSWTDENKKYIFNDLTQMNTYGDLSTCMVEEVKASHAALAVFIVSKIGPRLENLLGTPERHVMLYEQLFGKGDMGSVPDLRSEIIQYRKSAAKQK